MELAISKLAISFCIQKDKHLECMAFLLTLDQRLHIFLEISSYHSKNNSVENVIYKNKFVNMLKANKLFAFT